MIINLKFYILARQPFYKSLKTRDFSFSKYKRNHQINIIFFFLSGTRLLFQANYKTRSNNKKTLPKNPRLWKRLQTKQTPDNNSVTEWNSSSFQSSQYRNSTTNNYVAYVRHKHRLNINPNKPLFCYVPNNLPDKGEWQLYVPVPGFTH